MDENYVKIVYNEVEYPLNLIKGKGAIFITAYPGRMNVSHYLPYIPYLKRTVRIKQIEAGGRVITTINDSCIEDMISLLKNEKTALKKAG